jgi:hypothetical protein
MISNKDHKAIYICPLPCIVIAIGPNAEKRIQGT